MSEKKTNYKLLYHELLEKYDEMFNQLTSDLAKSCDENDVLKATNEESKKEITSLRHTIGGYITAIAKQKKDIANYKHEADSLKAENDSLKKQHSEDGELREQVEELKKRNAKISEEKLELKRQLEESKRAVDFHRGIHEHFLELPWYKRIFLK